MHRRILAAIGAIALTLPATAAVAATDGDDASSRFQKSETSGQISSSFTPATLSSDSRVTVVIEMEGDPVAVVQAEKGSELTSTEKSNVKSKLKKKQDAIRGSITGKGGKIQAQMQSAYNGFQASVPAKELDAVAKLPGVVAVHAVRTYTVDNATSVPFLGVPQVWKNTGYTGKGVKVAIIDTGIDYTHATFGGLGTTAAYDAAHANETQPADPAQFGPNAPRVKGGIDLVGDSYNADPDSDDYQPVPHPDPNPLDCNGHGSHVAGTAGGSGVTTAGATYKGPYDAKTPSTPFLVGPGVAPQVDLYGIRVFGCEGSTDVVVPAIDWAVENGMDVINMSLGSVWGRGDDPDAVAASNAVGAGVVVVASAGNSGHNPYMTGSPSTGDGVIAVSAVDSSESFPGATVTVGGRAITAINANGADLSGLGSLNVVRLVDDLSTTDEDESLGCSVEAYTSNGVTSGGNQLAVSTRGFCARVAKAIFAQQAGAAAALMVNNAPSLPPYEGMITSNPDTGEAYTVTIPFLGVSSADGGPFTTGSSATVAAKAITNPGFRGYASFTSGGPRSGDSALSPDVAAPGVSIASAGVGSGNGATILSGTSMAAPHVAGVAALSVQAHPKWSAPQVAASIVSTADPDKVAGQAQSLGGVGLVDAAQAVATQVTATGDAFRTQSGWARESALSFGFQESWLGFGGFKTITVQNTGKKAVTYKVSSAPSAQSLKAKVSFSSKSVTVKPGKSAKLVVTLAAAANAAPTSVTDDPFAFYEISGDVVLTSSDSTLRVPYLLVPRSNSKVTVGSSSPWFSKNAKVKNDSKSIKLSNALGAIDASADFYQWGLTDGKDATKALADTGYDLRAAGVQSFPLEGEELLVFAVNTHKRWSNAAGNEFDVVIDVDRDGTPDAVVFAVDSGLVRVGDPNGVSEVFVFDIASRELFPSGFLAQAPTDSSTVLLPVFAADLGISTGTFDYTVESYALVHDGFDAFSGWASFNAATPAVGNAQYEIVKRRGSVTVPVAIDSAAFADQKPLGSMVVVYDNQSGADEALLVKAK